MNELNGINSLSIQNVTRFDGTGQTRGRTRGTIAHGGRVSLWYPRSLYIAAETVRWCIVKRKRQRNIFGHAHSLHFWFSIIQNEYSNIIFHPFIPPARFVRPGSCSKNSTRCICLSSRAGASMVRSSSMLGTCLVWGGKYQTYFDSPNIMEPIFSYIHRLFHSNLTTKILILFRFEYDRTILWRPNRIEQDRNGRTTRRRTRSGMEGISSQPATRSIGTGSGKQNISWFAIKKWINEESTKLAKPTASSNLYSTSSFFHFLNLSRFIFIWIVLLVLPRTRSKIRRFDQRRTPRNRIPSGLYGEDQTRLGQQGKNSFGLTIAFDR